LAQQAVRLDVALWVEATGRKAMQNQVVCDHFFYYPLLYFGCHLVAASIRLVKGLHHDQEVNPWAGNRGGIRACHHTGIRLRVLSAVFRMLF
jgi:hypothetical protein